MGFLDGAARFLLWGGIMATAGALAFLIYTYVVFAGGGVPGSIPQAVANVELFLKVLLAGTIALGIATTFIFWGEEVLAPLQLMGAAVLFFAPNLLPMVAGAATNEVGVKAMGAIQMSGAILGLVGVLAAVADVTSRIKLRVREGSKADQMKYGKNVKEEKDIQNVFMGKCWQLPFCRKFVRERCPIYHARRTCWKEQVGCMCEEEVIRNAMEGKLIPKDAVAAGNYIPRNNKLTPQMKVERCKQCVIYNEHQKHKYKLAMPTILVICGGIYFLGRDPMKEALGKMIQNINKGFGSLTYQNNEQKFADNVGLTVFKELLMVCLVLVIAAYLMKLVEYLFFKAKI